MRALLYCLKIPPEIEEGQAVNSMTSCVAAIRRIVSGVTGDPLKAALFLVLSAIVTVNAPAAAAPSGAEARAQIRNDPLAPRRTQRGADVTLVLFSDYQCPYCRRLHPMIEQLLREDPKVSVVYRDWPILSQGSVDAAKAAIAASYQGKHKAMDAALMQIPGRIGAPDIREAARRAQVDWARLQADLKAHKDDIEALLGRSDLYATMLGLSGTPAMLVGPYLVPGAVDMAGLRKVVNLARSENPKNKTK